jgi:hypothetical protein
MSDCECDFDEYYYEDDYNDDFDKYEHLSYKNKEFLRWYYGKPKLDDNECYYDIEQDPEYFYEEFM